MARNEPCPRGDSCKFSHDSAEYLRNKQPDIGPECYNYRVRGRYAPRSLVRVSGTLTCWRAGVLACSRRCPAGIECRFAGDHTVDGHSIENAEVAQRYQPELDALSIEMQGLLRRRGAASHRELGSIACSLTHSRCSARQRTRSSSPRRWSRSSLLRRADRPAARMMRMHPLCQLRLSLRKAILLLQPRRPNPNTRTAPAPAPLPTTMLTPRSKARARSRRRCSLPTHPRRSALSVPRPACHR